MQCKVESIYNFGISHILFQLDQSLNYDSHFSTNKHFFKDANTTAIQSKLQNWKVSGGN